MILSLFFEERLVISNLVGYNGRYSIDMGLSWYNVCNAEVYGTDLNVPQFESLI